jgi:very-short-patch-repair endonuclease
MSNHHTAGSVGRARHLRQAMTLPEKLLWKELRRLKLNIRRQAPLGRYVVDFASHTAALVVEIDGARHDLPEAQLHDHERTRWLTGQGYRVMRFRNDDVLADAPSVAEQIRAAIASTRALPLDGGGLGGGEATGDEGKAREASLASLSSSPACSPPSPALPPSRGKGEVGA